MTSPSPGFEDSKEQGLLKLFWIVWGAVLLGLVLIYFALGATLPAVDTTAKGNLVHLVGIVPLFISIVIRWLVLPRFNSLARMFPLFIAGLALAEGCGLLGIFLGGPYRQSLFVLGLFGIFQFMPLFRSYLNKSDSQFRPNN